MEPDTIVTLDIAGTVLEGLEVKIHRSDNGEYHWTAYAANGRKIATTGETYQSQQHAAKMAVELFPTARIRAADGNDWQFDAK